MLRTPSLLLLALLATTASAQSGGHGLFAAYGGAAPERLLFPDDADPDLTVGARLSRTLELEAGFQVRTRESTVISYVDLAAQREWTKTGAAVLALAYADKVAAPGLRAAHVQARLSLGYDDFSAFRQTYRPDSVTVRTPDGPFPGYALVPDDSRAGLGKYVHLGGSVEAGVPVQFAAVSARPALGLAATLSSATSGSLAAQGARVMPYATVPVTVRLAGLAATAEVTAGMTKGTYDRDRGRPFSHSGLARSNWAPLVEGSLRLDL